MFDSGRLLGYRIDPEQAVPMTFISILFALLIEQLKPLRADNPVYSGVRLLARRMETWFNAGQARHGILGWVAMIAALVLPTALVYWLCARISPLAALAWNIVIVYLTLGFRHYSHYFTSIQLALNAGDEVSARSLLADWTGQDTAGLDVGEISRMAVEKALVDDASQRVRRIFLVSDAVRPGRRGDVPRGRIPGACLERAGSHAQ